jgi:Ca-activated chloride channel homolog
MKKRFNISFLLLTGLMIILTQTGVFAQNENRFIRRGNDAFEKSDFQTAEIEYRKALEKNRQSSKGEFNLGGALYEQENFDEASKLFGGISGEAETPELRAKSHYNLGNTLMKMQEYEAAIESYKNALRLNPQDFDSKYNLEYARHQLREQQQQQQQNQQQNQDQNDNQENQQNRDNQQNNDQQNQNEQQEQEQQTQSDQQDNQSGQQQQQNQQDSRQISKEDAERMLQALRDREKSTLDKIKRERFQDARRVKTEKDW